MLANVGLFSYLAPALTYGGLAIALLLSWRSRSLGIVLIACCFLTGCWGAIIAAGTIMEYPPVELIQLAELARNASWMYFLIRLSALRFGSQNARLEPLLIRRFAIGIAVVLALLFALPAILGHYNIESTLPADAAFASWLGMAILGLLLIEQLFRNASEGERWSLKYLCFGLGGIFAYDFFMYAEALLFRDLDTQLWQARGLVTAFAAPLIATSISRNTETQFSLQVSRKVVFHSVTLLGAGFYLIMMAVVGYFIKFMDATWGGVLQISFLVATGAMLLALLFSGKIRAQTRVLLSKHFFTYKYDYREEWLKFTQTLAGISNNAPEGIIRAMAPLVNSPGGLLWGSDDGTHYRLLSHWQMAEPDSPQLPADMPAWLNNSGWVIDLDELKVAPDVYGDLCVPDWLLDRSDAWLIIPLMFSDRLQGLLVLRRPELKPPINWEDRDLLKTAGRQAATHLAQYLASQDLVEARQFEAFNRLSAYVIHDLKNILAQQSLMVANAKKHKSNPEFIEDMITTVSNSVDRMTKLMEQMRSGVRGSGPLIVDLKSLLEEVIASRSNEAPIPTLQIVTPSVMVEANRERLLTVFAHLVKNAQDATAKSGRVEVKLDYADNHALIDISDTGAGMDKAFVRSRLFKPFDSTKGLTGMGIGAFESREFIRSLGGDIQVNSTPGEGSLFRVSLPYHQDEDLDQP